VPLNRKQAAQLKTFGNNLRRERMRKKITQELTGFTFLYHSMS
jgi:hypothetical protein